MRLREAPEIRFFKTNAGMATAVALGVAVLAGTVAWVRRGRGEEGRKRQAMLIAATGTTALGWAFAGVARQQGWLRGAYFELPLATQLAIDVPLSIGYYTAWLGGFRWLSRGARHPYALYGALTAAFSPVALTAGAWEMSRGYYRLGNGWRLGYNALVVQPMMWAPLLMYEGLKDRLPEAVERPEQVEAKACGMPKEPMMAFGSV